MFNRKDEVTDTPTMGHPPTPRIEFPDVITYEVLESDGKWHAVRGHSVQIVDGCLMIGRGIFVDAGFTQPSAVPSALYAPGQWLRCKTDYAGHVRKSDLLIN